MISLSNHAHLLHALSRQDGEVITCFALRPHHNELYASTVRFAS